MATDIPAPLKTADITRFTIRAAQVEKVKPAVAYWCYYYVIDKILKQSLHKQNDQCQNYVVSLMDRAEAMKSEHADDDAFQDEVAAKAYMEQFGLETFLRADNAVRANKASKTTADTFQAAYTFLDVLNVWPPLDQEIADKIKYAKYHAVRIAKAIKAGEDPNDSNPAVESEVAAPPALDANDPEVQAIAGTSADPELPPAKGSALGSETNGTPDFVDRPPISPPEAPISLPPYPNENSSRSVQSMPHHDNPEDYYHNTTHSDVASSAASAKGGYFSPVAGNSSSTTPILPGPPTEPPGTVQSPLDHQAPATTSNQPSLRQNSAFQPTPASIATPDVADVAVEVDDAKVASAQKHARFAISALNFEDVNTAVKELRAALADLGQR